MLKWSFIPPESESGIKDGILDLVLYFFTIKSIDIVYIETNGKTTNRHHLYCAVESFRNDMSPIKICWNIILLIYKCNLSSDVVNMFEKNHITHWGHFSFFSSGYKSIKVGHRLTYFGPHSFESRLQHRVCVFVVVSYAEHKKGMCAVLLYTISVNISNLTLVMYDRNYFSLDFSTMSVGEVIISAQHKWWRIVVLSFISMRTRTMDFIMKNAGSEFNYKHCRIRPQY